ncbi:otolin-1-like [Pecten maximus]|uniref:otolin-1-like n=1 Tax=Pecten maximus TaxID=6579 RepID=UPI00145891B8|nr:otolin-1-like [Pecten maximus]
MDVLLISMLFVIFGLVSGDAERSTTSSLNSLEDIGSHVLTSIFDLKNRVDILEDTRAGDLRRMHDMQSEIDELKSENDRLKHLAFDRLSNDRKVIPEMDRTSSEYRLDDEISSENVEIELSQLYKYILNNKSGVATERNDDGSGTTELDVPQQGTKISRNLFRRRHSKEPSIPTHRGSTRVAPAGAVAFHANLGTTVSSPAINREIVFDHVLTNNGNGYSEHTGTFTCQQAGTYVFSWNIVSLPHQFVDSHLVKNGVILASTVSASSYHTGTSTGLVAVQLESGDDIWVKLGNHENGGNVVAWSMFSGFKLN